MKTIEQGELTRRISKDAGIRPAVVKEVLQSFLYEIVEELDHGNKVRLLGFASLDRRVRRPHWRENWKTGDAVFVPEYHFVRFRMGSLLRRRMNPSKEAQMS